MMTHPVVDLTGVDFEIVSSAFDYTTLLRFRIRIAKNAPLPSGTRETPEFKTILGIVFLSARQWPTESLCFCVI